MRSDMAQARQDSPSAASAVHGYVEMQSASRQMVAIPSSESSFDIGVPAGNLRSGVLGQHDSLLGRSRRHTSQIEISHAHERFSASSGDEVVERFRST
jgi:hypothetical protein